MSPPNQTVNRVLDLMEIELPEDLFRRWNGPERPPANRAHSNGHERRTITEREPLKTGAP